MTEIPGGKSVYCVHVLKGHSISETALILAATTGDSTAAVLLLQHGADPGATGILRLLPLVRLYLCSLLDMWGKSAIAVAHDHGESAVALAIQNFIDGKGMIIRRTARMTNPQSDHCSRTRTFETTDIHTNTS